MLVVVLDYTDGSVHFHKIPDIKSLENIYGEDSPIEDYLTNTLDYSADNIHWMEVKC